MATALKFRTVQQMDAVYQKLNKEHQQPPYVIEVGNDNQQLIFVGASHTNDPKDPQIDKLKKYWNRFLDQTDKQKSVVFNEGGKWPIARSEKEAIEQYSEAGYISYLANSAHRRYVSPEPSDKKEADYLKNKYGEMEVILYYFVRQIPQWQRTVPRPDFEEYMKDMLQKYQSRLGWDHKYFELDSLKALFRQKTGVILRRNLTKALWPAYFPKLSKVSDASGEFRDKHIFEQIRKYWGKGYSIFIVYGSGHAIVLEPAIRELAK